MTINVNGKDYTLSIPAHTSLLDVLRVHLDLTGSKYGCGEGACGACKVLVDGHAIPACITPAASVQHKKVVTIEGLEQNGQLHPVQQAFLDHDAFQCAFCSSGMVVSAVALKAKNPHPTRQEVVSAMERNVCRCCIYPRIVDAIMNA